MSIPQANSSDVEQMPLITSWSISGKKLFFQQVPTVNMPVLVNRNVYLELVRLLLERDVCPELDTPAEDALRDQVQSGPGNADSKLLLQALSVKAKIRLMKYFRDQIIISDSDKRFVIETYGDDIIAYGKLEEKADDLVADGFRRIIERQNEAEIQWLVQVLEDVPELRIRSMEESWSGFEDRVRRASQAVINDDEPGALQVLFKYLGLAEFESAPTEETL